MGPPATRVRGYILASRVVEGRVHQHAINCVRGKPTRLQCIYIFGIESERTHPVIQPIESRIVRRERAQVCVDLDKRNFQSGNTRREREAGRADT